MARPYDLVVYGGSGFTGRLAAEYLARRYTAGGSDSSSETVRWAIAGRDRAKLDAVVQSIERKHPHAKGKIDVLVGSDPASLETLASKTNALVSFAGPFAKVGMPVVDACVKCGTDYCDITGEPTFIRDVVDKHDAAARAAGTCVVNCVGYDSAPWDLGAWAVSEWFASRGDVCEMARGHLGSAKGGVSGGTIASAIGLVASTPWKTLAAMASPHFLSDAPPSDPNVLAKWKIQSGVAYDRDLGRWTMPSVMAGINAKVVARSSAIARSPNGPYSPSFAYDESDLCSGFFGAALGTAALAVFGGALMFPPARWLLQATILPAPGQGPSERLRETGFAHAYVVGEGRDPAAPKAVAHMEFKGADPGYKGTAALAVEAALCLALPAEREKTPGRARGGGCLTPATALGGALVERMNKSDTLGFSVKPLADVVVRA